MPSAEWLERIRQKLPAMMCRESPKLMLCMHWDWPECIEATTPALMGCIPKLRLPSSVDLPAMEANGRTLLQCALSELLLNVRKGPWDGGCMNVINQTALEPAIKVVFYQNGAIRSPRNGKVRLTDAPFVIHVSAKKGTPGVYVSKAETPFRHVDMKNPLFLSPQREHECAPDALCPSEQPFTIQPAPALFASAQKSFSRGAAEELRQIALTYEDLAQVVLTDIHAGNFRKTEQPGNFEYRVTETAPLRDGKTWIAIVMNDQPELSFPYARLRPILIELERRE